MGSMNMDSMEFDYFGLWPTLVSGAIGFITGVLSSDYIKDNMQYFLIRTGSRLIDNYVELKWKLWPPSKSIEKDVCTSFTLKWLTKNENYAIYELDGSHYISFNLDHDPQLHYEDGWIESIKVIRAGSSSCSVIENKSIHDILFKCGGHGCTFNAGIPTLEQLSKLPFEDLRQELQGVTKIIVTNNNYDEFVIT